MIAKDRCPWRHPILGDRCELSIGHTPAHQVLYGGRYGHYEKWAHYKDEPLRCPIIAHSNNGRCIREQGHESQYHVALAGNRAGGIKWTIGSLVHPCKIDEEETPAMSTNAVPGAVKSNNDELAMGAWAEHADGSMIFVESVEADTVVYSIFDVGVTPPVEYRDAMPEKGFKSQFTWKPGSTAEKWTWHDKTPFPWQRVMKDFPAGQKMSTSAGSLRSAAERVAESLNLRAGKVRDRIDLPAGNDDEIPASWQRAASSIMLGIKGAVDALKK